MSQLNIFPIAILLICCSVYSSHGHSLKKDGLQLHYRNDEYRLVRDVDAMEAMALCNTTGPTCVWSCEGLGFDTAHQWCGACTSFVYCDDTAHIAVCPPGRVWNDCVSQCVPGTVSLSCVECYDPEAGVGIVGCNPPTTTGDLTNPPEPTLPPAVCNATGPGCIDTCQGLPDGYYQWCGGCLYFIACTAGIPTLSSCPANSPWDDCSKRCQVFSRTCVECYYGDQFEINCEGTGTDGTTEPTTTASTTPAIECESTGALCFTDCGAELPDGNYQNCRNCKSFLTCANQATFISACPSGLVWDDIIKGCDRTSRTCVECVEYQTVQPRALQEV